MSVDRIDFLRLTDERVIVQKLRRDTTDRRPRDIPVSHEVKSDFDLEWALDWCRANGYTVRTWPGGARAWKGTPWPIRTWAQIQQRRQQAEREARQGNGTNWHWLSLDFAYDA